jgi:hypothetical protein
MSSLHNLENMSGLFLSASQFENSLKSHKESVDSSKGNVDKHSFKFVSGGSDRFNAAQFKFYLEAYRGNYGSSSCYTNKVYSCSNEDLNKALTSYLNKNKETFLRGVSEELKFMAQESLQSAQKEVDEINRKLDEVKAAASAAHE